MKLCHPAMCPNCWDIGNGDLVCEQRKNGTERAVVVFNGEPTSHYCWCLCRGQKKRLKSRLTRSLCVRKMKGEYVQ